VRKRKRTAYVARAVDEHVEGNSDQSFLPVSEEQTAMENSYISRVCNNDNRIWETKVVLAQIWTNK
jgi:hypothetical protein